MTPKTINKYLDTKLTELLGLFDEEDEMRTRMYDANDDEGVGYCEGQMAGLSYHIQSVRHLIGLVEKLK
jgi:hypothetical protein